MPATPPDPPRAELAARWSALHHDLDPDAFPLLAGWLRLMWSGGRVLARCGVPPTAVTVSGVALAAGAVAVAGDHPGAAVLGVVGAAACDGLDGATAVVLDRPTRTGAVADAVADRLCDGAFAAVLWRRGAPLSGALAAAGVAWGVDTLRRIRRIPDRVTVAERPTFTICAALACAAGAATGADASRFAARASTAVWIAAGIAGLGQLLRTPSQWSGSAPVPPRSTP